MTSVALMVKGWDVPSCSMTEDNPYSRKLGFHWTPMGKQGMEEAGEQYQERKITKERAD